jgi:hypothetical protein
MPMNKELKAIIKEISEVGGVLGFVAKLCQNNESMATQLLKDMESHIHNSIFSEELKQRITNYLKKIEHDHKGQI